METSSNVTSDETARYDEALEMVRYEGRNIWTILGSFLLAETVLLSVLGAGLVRSSTLVQGDWILFVGSLFGLLLCVPWWSAVTRNSAYYHFRIHQAKRVEKELSAKLLVEGAKFSKGDKVVIDGTCHRMPWLARNLHTSVSARLLIAVYALMFLTIVVLHQPF